MTLMLSQLFQLFAFLLLGMYLAYRDADDKKENWVVKIPLGKGKETL